MATVGLAMMVRNEAHVVERALASVRHLVDHWLVVDTGSTDGTQDLVRQAMAGLPGALYERPWVDFGHNRTELVQAARVAADYTLMLDADDVLETPAGFAWPGLETELGEIVHRCGTLSSRRAALLSNRLSWHFHGVRDEYLHAPRVVSSTLLTGLTVRQYRDGGRMLGRTFADVRADDAAAIAEAMRSAPDHPGYQYHLARALRDSEQHEAALEAFRHRAGMGDNPEEVADSLLEVAHHLVRLGADTDTAYGAYLSAWDARPSRAEPLVALARYAREQGRFSVAALAAARAQSLARPDDTMWVDEEVYAWRSRDEHAVSAYWTGDYATCAALSRDLLADDLLPPAQRERLEANLRHAETALAATGAAEPEHAPEPSDAPQPEPAREVPLPGPRSGSAPAADRWEPSWTPGPEGATLNPSRVLIRTDRRSTQLPE